MNGTNELRLKVLDAWRRITPEQRQTDKHAEAFAVKYAASHGEVSYDQVLA